MFDPKLPLSLATTLPASYYQKNERSPFETSWQYVCALDRLQNDGDYLTCKILNNSIVVLRENGVLRGFHNVCRHHAATLLKGCGTCTKIRCPYHGWTYGLDGSLRGIPEFGGVENFKAEDNGLKPVEVTSFGPFVFACLESKTLYPLYPMVTCGDSEPKFIVPLYKFLSGRTYNLKCNWKVFVDNYLDGGYHVNYIHPFLASGINYSKYRSELYDKAVLQIAPLKASDNSSRSGTEAYYWWFYPNFMVNIYGNMMDVNHVIPTGPATCQVIIDWYGDSNNSPGTIFDSVEISEHVQQEDIEICERVQEGLESDSYVEGRYSVIREGGMYYFHQLISGAK